VAAALGGLIVAGAAGVLVWRSPAVTESPAVTAPEARRVVVAVFANRSGDPSLDPLGDIVADYLARGLAETGLVEVIDARAEQADDADARARGVAGARALARAVGAGSVIWGAYYHVGDSLQFQAQLTDAATGELIGATTPAIGPARQQTEGVEILRQRVITALAARLDPEFSRFEGATRPASYDAYREYLAGDALDLKPCPAERDCQAELIAHFWRAYALDSSFTLPLVAIASASSVSDQCARTDSLAEALRPRRNRLPVAERARLDVATHLCSGKPLLAQEAARQGMAAAPRSDRLVKGYGWLARHNGFLREAIAVTEKLDRKRNERDPGYWGNLIIPYHLLGEHERELEAARASTSALPGNIESLSFEARALVGLGRLDEVNAVLTAMLRVPEDAPQQAGKAYWIDQVGRDLRAHGHVKEAQGVFERGIRWYQTLPPNVRAEDGQRRLLAVLLYDLTRWREALPIIRDYSAKYPEDMSARSALGAVYARLGDREHVDTVDRWLASRKDRFHTYNRSPTYERARLAAIVGERGRAMALLRQAGDEGAWLDSGGGFGPHSDPDFEWLRDYAPFQELMKPKG
jgi:tetratricopeptide (TPR) repeat protein/TolB-like protein